MIGFLKTPTNEVLLVYIFLTYVHTNTLILTISCIISLVSSSCSTEPWILIVYLYLSLSIRVCAHENCSIMATTASRLA
ncbi:hypothetical protein BDC45DRAFT_512402 [Circinella umbellata]|nr:hypothetical protein BDC45DRAFT_512402 [Circinella umbellata]